MAFATPTPGIVVFKDENDTNVLPDDLTVLPTLCLRSIFALQGQGENAALNPKARDMDLCHLGAPGRSPLPAGPGAARCSAGVRSDAARGS